MYSSMETEYEYEVVNSQKCTHKMYSSTCALVHLKDDVLEYEKVYSSDVLRNKRGSMSVN